MIQKIATIILKNIIWSTKNVFEVFDFQMNWEEK